MCFSEMHKSCLRIGWLFFFLFSVYLIPSAQAENFAESPHIRVLAASCAACHGTNGNSVSGTPVLAGLDKNHFMLQLQAFRSGERSATVMHRHAKGLTVDEIDQLATYFSQQKRGNAEYPPNQILDVNRE
jgi:cytochrome subunit of sulfide dehydrogenase